MLSILYDVAGQRIIAYRQGKVEGGPLIGLRFAPHPASMPLDNALYRGQTNSRAFKLILGVQALKC
jgi:hypothetical protein